MIDVRVVAQRDGSVRERIERITVEEPLEIRLAAAGETARVAITMRTPGSDIELAAGFLFTEGILIDRSAIVSIRQCDDPRLEPDERGNVVTVALRGLVRSERC